MKKLFIVIGVVVLFAVGWRAFWAYQQTKLDKQQAQNSASKLTFDKQIQDSTLIPMSDTERAQEVKNIQISPEQALRPETFHLGELQHDLNIIEIATKVAMVWQNDAQISTLNMISGAYPINNYTPLRFFKFDSVSTQNNSLGVVLDWSDNFVTKREEQVTERAEQLNLNDIKISSRRAFEFSVKRAILKHVELTANSTIDFSLDISAKTGTPRWVLMVSPIKENGLQKKVYLVQVDAMNGSIIADVVR